MIEPVGLGAVRAKWVDALIRRFMGPNDRIVHVIEQGLVANTSAVVADVVGIPESALNTTALKPFCKGKGPRCVGYRLAALKYVWGLVTCMRQLLKMGRKRPQWVVVKDDDTYVHVPNLLKLGASLTNHTDDLVGIANKGCSGICGGAGWLLTGGLANAFVGKPGDEYLAFQAEKSAQIKSFQYDMFVPKAHTMVPGAKLINSLAFHPFPPGEAHLCLYKADHKPPCVRTVECNCSRTERPVTWHLACREDQAHYFLDPLPSLS